jgi:hypothetical protein
VGLSEAIGCGFTGPLRVMPSVYQNSFGVCGNVFVLATSCAASPLIYCSENFRCGASTEL